MENKYLYYKDLFNKKGYSFEHITQLVNGCEKRDYIRITKHRQSGVVEEEVEINTKNGSIVISEEHELNNRNKIGLSIAEFKLLLTVMYDCTDCLKNHSVAEKLFNEELSNEKV